MHEGRNERFVRFVPISAVFSGVVSTGAGVWPNAEVGIAKAAMEAVERIRAYPTRMTDGSLSLGLKAAGCVQDMHLDWNSFGSAGFQIRRPCNINAT